MCRILTYTMTIQIFGFPIPSVRTGNHQNDNGWIRPVNGKFPDIQDAFASTRCAKCRYELIYHSTVKISYLLSFVLLPACR